jgi:hypothetical protein
VLQCTLSYSPFVIPGLVGTDGLVVVYMALSIHQPVVKPTESRPRSSLKAERM